MSKTAIKQNSVMCHPVTLPELGIEIDRVSVSPVAFATWVRSLLQNWRQGTVACKGRSDVNRTNKKPWKQKGTGRARAGTARSPLWRGGGIIFGPMARTRRLQENKKIRRSVMLQLLQNRIEQGNLYALSWMVNGELPSTAQAYKALKHVHLHDKKIVLFVVPGDVVSYASFSNLPNVSVLFFDQSNAFDVASGRSWVFLKKMSNNLKKW